MNGSVSHGLESVKRAVPDPISTGLANGGRSPVAVVGTLAEFRPDPTRYDLATLVRFVRDIGPDLLCLDMTLAQWQRRDFGGLPIEYRDALLPLADQTDIVVVPIGDGGGSEESTDVEDGSRGPAGPRRRLTRRLNGAVASLESGVRSPVAVDQGVRHHVAETLYHVIDWLHGPSSVHAVHAHRDALVQRIVEVARHDAGRRILVVVNARYCHHLRRELRRQPEVSVVSYSEL